MGNPNSVEAFFGILNARRYEQLARLVEPGVITEWPQSGERIRGIGNTRAAFEHDPYPAYSLIQRVIGAEDKWVLTPSFTLVGVAGTGDHYIAEARTKYANGDTSGASTSSNFRMAST